jgi:serine protease Do
MSHQARNWLKLVTIGAGAFVLSLFFSGFLDFPRESEAQDFGPGTRATTISQVSAPSIPSAGPLAELSDAFSAVAEAVRPSVVFVRSRRSGPSAAQQVPPGFEPFFRQPEAPNGGQRMQQSSGSGFIVSSNGYILTNNHVIAGATEVSVRLLDGRVFAASVVGRDSTTDVAVLHIDADNLTPAALGSSGDVRVGEWVLAIGNPLGSELTFSVTQGIISAKGRGLNDLNNSVSDIQDFIQTDAAINRGNSGGPLVNVRGEVIGINSAIASETGYYSGYAFAVPMDLARAVMNQIIEKGRVERTEMGVYVQTATVEDAEYLELPSISGVRIEGFSGDESPARRAGLREGDVILSVDGTEVKYVAQLQQVVGFRSAGEIVKVTVARTDGNKEFSVRLLGADRSSENLAVSGQGDTTQPVVEPNPEMDNALRIDVEPITSSLIQQMQLPDDTKGLLIRAIDVRAPSIEYLCALEGCASRQRAPDVIVAVEGQPVSSEAEFKRLLRDGGRNGIITLKIKPAVAGAQSRIERIRLTPRQ